MSNDFSRTGAGSPHCHFQDQDDFSSFLSAPAELSAAFFDASLTGIAAGGFADSLRLAFCLFPGVFTSPSPRTRAVPAFSDAPPGLQGACWGESRRYCSSHSSIVVWTRSPAMGRSGPWPGAPLPSGCPSLLPTGASTRMGGEPPRSNSPAGGACSLSRDKGSMPPPSALAPSGLYIGEESGEEIGDVTRKASPGTLLLLSSTKNASPAGPNFIFNPTFSPFTLMDTTFSFGFKTPLSLPKRTWNGVHRMAPSSSSTAMISMAPLRVALFSPRHRFETPRNKFISWPSYAYEMRAYVQQLPTN